MIEFMRCIRTPLRTMRIPAAMNTASNPFYIVRAVVGALYLWMFVTLALRSAAALRANAAAPVQPAGQSTIDL
jgi:hypothetical protein